MALGLRAGREIDMVERSHVEKQLYDAIKHGIRPSESELEAIVGGESVPGRSPRRSISGSPTMRSGTSSDGVRVAVLCVVGRAQASGSGPRPGRGNSRSYGGYLSHQVPEEMVAVHVCRTSAFHADCLGLRGNDTSRLLRPRLHERREMGGRLHAGEGRIRRHVPGASGHLHPTTMVGVSERRVPIAS